jgi:hypothetical protein
LYRSGGDDDRQQQALRINEHVPLAPFDQFGFVKAAAARHGRRLDALAIQTTRRRLFVSAHPAAHLGP